MGYIPALPASGLIGWHFLKRTEQTQTTTFQETAQIKRSVANALDKLPNIQSAKDLVSDRQTTNTVLTAYGLQDDINSQFLVQKILESDLTDRTSLANRMSDKRYKTMAEDLQNMSAGLTAKTVNTVVNRFKALSFELAIGEQDETLRLAMNTEREIQDIAAQDTSENTKWYTILGNPPLKQVFQTVFRLPASIGKLDLDRQLDEFKSRSEPMFGSSDLAIFNDSEKVDDLVQKFLIQTQLNDTQSIASSHSIALSLLQTASF